MSEGELEEPLFPDQPLLSVAQVAHMFGGSETAFEVQGTQSSQPVSIPDSYVPVSRVQLPAVPLAGLPPGARAAHDRLKPAFANALPNVHRCYDAKSRAIAHVAWEFVSAPEVWEIVTCKLLGAGKLESMSWYKNHAVSWVHDLMKNFVQVAKDDAVTQKVRVLSIS